MFLGGCAEMADLVESGELNEMLRGKMFRMINVCFLKYRVAYEVTL
jgi:hypothetical protein